MTKQRLSKVLASAGVASRRAAEQVIQDRRVIVNGEVASLPQLLVDPNVDKILVDRKPLARAAQKVYYALHKPLGYHCTNAPHIKRRAVDLLEESKTVRLFTVGRLDKDTSGLIIVTNDGHLANRLMHPSGGVKKEYIAKVDKEITHEHLKVLAAGCVVEGSLVRPVRVAKVRRGTLRVVVQEGRKHEVRELLTSAGLTVIELKRVRIGNLALGSLPVGAFRKISPEELCLPHQDSGSTEPGASA